MRRFCLLALALSGASTAALAQPLAALPDFPTEARPGECWARRPLGPVPMSGPPAQSVWTLEQGSGPGAVWNYSEAPAGRAHGHAGPLGWARVDCRSGDVVRYAEGQPPAPHEAPAYAPPPHVGPYPGAHPPSPYGDPLGGMGPAGPYAPPPSAPYADPLGGDYAGPAGPYSDPSPPPPPVLHRAPPTFMHTAHPHQRPFPAPQFGARFLHWPGKTPR